MLVAALTQVARFDDRFARIHLANVAGLALLLSAGSRAGHSSIEPKARALSDLADRVDRHCRGTRYRRRSALLCALAGQVWIYARFDEWAQVEQAAEDVVHSADGLAMAFGGLISLETARPRGKQARR
jgi:hypothetical protein